MFINIQPGVAADLGRVKTVVSFEQVNAAINRAKQQEQKEVGQKRYRFRLFSTG